MTTSTLMTPVPDAVSPPAPRRRSFYRPELDILRFFAFLAVFLYHFTRPVELYVQHGIPRVIAALGNGLIQGGVFGVDLFFVLSAYLITELLLREKDECGSLDVRGFYLRRILRIWPLYFFYIGVAPDPDLQPQPRVHLAPRSCVPAAGRELEHHCLGLADSINRRALMDCFNRRAVLPGVAADRARTVPNRRRMGSNYDARHF